MFVFQIFYKVADFEFPEELVENFLHPPVMSISEVKASPSKKRVSVTGNVGEVSLFFLCYSFVNFVISSRYSFQVSLLKQQCLYIAVNC